MFIVDNKIVSSELFSVQFICNLSQCKGACCWKGDFGAPVTEGEIAQINEVLEIVKPMLSKESQHLLDKEGVAKMDPLYKGMVTPLHQDGACVYLTKNDEGIARCVFEKAFEEEKIKFRKPISCHLYPVRVSVNNETDFEALNYDEWDICKSACHLGQEHQMPVFRFVKSAIVRQYGNGFYDQLEDIYSSFFV